MSGISHWTCPKCQRSFAHMISGRSLGAPKCYHCGHTIDADAVARDEATINAIRDRLEAESQAEWDARAPDQEAAWEAGRAARRQYDADGQPPLVGTQIRSGPLAANERCPYKYIPRAPEQHPLRDWWHRGWTHEEFEPKEDPR